MNTCLSCNSVVFKTDRFCRNCGAVNPFSVTSDGRTGFILVAVSAIIVLGLNLLAFLHFSTVLGFFGVGTIDTASKYVPVSTQILLLSFVFRGDSWARWIMGLLSLAAMILGLVFISDYFNPQVIDAASLSFILSILATGSVGAILLFSPSVRAFQRDQRQAYMDKSEIVSELPWKDYPSIYAHINQHLDPEGNLLESGETLPDDERRFQPGDLQWIAGGKDGAFGHHGGGGGDENKAKNVANLVNAIARTGDVWKQTELYTILLDDNVIDFIDPTINAIIALKPLIKPYLLPFARWLVTASPDRGPLKFGIALLGLMRDESSIDKILLVGKHNEFTLFSAVAVLNMLENPEPVLWEMAKAVDGWGRIHLVERLAGTKDASIKDWLLREGYKNQIMNEYLAYKCATTGELHMVLSAEHIDAGLVTSAGELIMALITGIDILFENIDDYEYAGLVIQEYLRHLAPQADQLAHLIIADALYQFLTASNEEWKTRSQQRAWATVDRHQLTDITQQIIQKPLWHELVETHRQTEDDMLFWYVKLAARILQIDLWDTYWARLQAGPDDSVRWFDVMAHVNAERIGEVIQFAQTHLALEDIATGPAKERGFGKELKAHLCLDHVLGKLDQFPGYGELLIKAGLQSPVIRNRIMAIRALAAWGQAYWSEGMREFLQDVQQHEPDVDVKTEIQNALKGESL